MNAKKKIKNNMPTGTYKRTKRWKVKDTSRHRGGSKGKHWKVKDTTNSRISAKKSTWKTQQTRRERGWFKDIDKAKENFRKCHLGVKLTETHKQNIGLAGKGRKMSKEAIDKIKIARAKQILPVKDTSIELKMQEILTKNNVQFEKHKPIIGQPDIFIEPNVCIFCDGDYWHNRPERKRRDEYVNRKLTEQGYVILRFWEHQINNNLEMCFNTLRQYAKN